MEMTARMSSASDAVQTGTIETNIPQRLDRLPWSRFHWLIVIGLGTVWILDGLEVTIVGSVASRLTESGSGISISTAGIGVAAAFYVGGACIGALFFGQLTDRFGRKKLFLITLALYIAATVATGFAWTAWYFYLMRFFTGAGIGGEYAAINSAIDELIPARVRGRVDLIINGSYWLGAVAGAAVAIVLLNESILAANVGWRVCFALGAILGLAIMLVRRNVPESPRWLFIHGREEEAERIVDSIEEDVQDETGERLDEPDETIEVRQRKRIPFRSIAETAFKIYPKRSVLCLALFIGQAFIYNAVTFDLGTIFTGFFNVASGFVPVFFILFAVGNFLGPLLLGRLFDTVGRRPMIALTYLGSAAVLVPTAILFQQKSLTQWSFIGLIMGAFFLASAGASAAYLTASEIFPMETRALAIAFFYAVGTAAGGITGPLFFGKMIDSGSVTNVMIAFLVGAAVMAVGGIAEVFLGVDAEQVALEDIAKPLTAREAEEAHDDGGRREPRRDEETVSQRHRAREARRSRGVYGARRFRPGPGTSFYSPGMIGTAYTSRRAPEHDLDSEVDAIASALEQDGPADRRTLSRRVRAQRWGPGRFSGALHEALAEGVVRRRGRLFEAVTQRAREQQAERERTTR
jgi:MFS family permease